MLSLGNSLEDRIDIEEIKEKHTIIEITEDLEVLETLQAVIILEGNISDLSMICELISKVRQKSTCYIWVMTTTEKSVGKLVYLQLGADEVFDFSRESKEIVFIVENSLLRLKKFQITEECVMGNHHTEELLKLIPTNVSVMIEGNKEIILTKLEFQMWNYYCDIKGRPLAMK